jgi:hypothetical protein
VLHRLHPKARERNIVTRNSSEHVSENVRKKQTGGVRRRPETKLSTIVAVSSERLHCLLLLSSMNDRTMNDAALTPFLVSSVNGRFLDPVLQGRSLARC